MPQLVLSRSQHAVTVQYAETSLEGYPVVIAKRYVPCSLHGHPVVIQQYQKLESPCIL